MVKTFNYWKSESVHEPPERVNISSSLWLQAMIENVRERSLTIDPFHQRLCSRDDDDEKRETKEVKSKSKLKKQNVSKLFRSPIKQKALHFSFSTQGEKIERNCQGFRLNDWILSIVVETLESFEVMKKICCKLHQILSSLKDFLNKFPWKLIASRAERSASSRERFNDQWLKAPIHAAEQPKRAMLTTTNARRAKRRKRSSDIFNWTLKGARRIACLKENYINNWRCVSELLRLFALFLKL